MQVPHTECTTAPLPRSYLLGGQTAALPYDEGIAKSRAHIHSNRASSFFRRKRYLQRRARMYRPIFSDPKLRQRNKVTFLFDTGE